MIQIRKNIFETNSSTTHCLVIGKTPDIKEKIEEFKKEHGTHIVFGKMLYKDVYDNVLWKDPSMNEDTPFQVKADMLYFSMYVWTDGTDVLSFLYRRQKLTEKLNELGFTVEYREDPELLNEDNNYRTYDIDENMWDYMWNDMDEIVNYLFGKYVLYYSWCDEGCMECPHSIDEAIHRFSQYEKNGEAEFEVHHYR